MDLVKSLASSLELSSARVAAALALLDAGNTVPFVARYRKEATGGLDEEQLRAIEAEAASQRALAERRATVLATVAGQGKLTPELEARIQAAATPTALEDLYQPFKPKRRTRAGMARERGLEPLAEQILAQPRERASPAALATPYLGEAVPDVEAAWAGARDIVAEAISDHPDVRGAARARGLKWGEIVAARATKDGAPAPDERGVYRLYYDFNARLSRLRPHQVLALNRGEAEGVLRVRVTVPERDWRGAIADHFRPDRRSPLADQLEQAIEDAAARLLLPAIERDIRRALTETAERHAIAVFAANLRSLLGGPPLAGHTALGLDPGFRTGCKVAVVDPTGRVLETATIYPHPPQKQVDAARATLRRLIGRHGVTLIAIGNGTASRETEGLVADLIQSGTAGEARYLLVNEAGASVYSASPLARAELPELDVSLRGAVSIARRAQDPLAELVKIDPRSIGVGLYQHDVDQKALAAALDDVVESVVNRVGVDVNTASAALLRYVAGIGPSLAEKIVAHREAQGPFASRAALRDVAGLGPKAFEQSAGFLRVRGGAEPLDASAIHPESYAVARTVLARVGLTPTSSAKARAAALSGWREPARLAMLAEELGAGAPTLADILEQLIRPGRDPREDLPPPILRQDVLAMEDLRPGMRLAGTVRNVVDFGAFVDIGVKQDGLLHRSQIPRDADLGVGDVITVTVNSVEIDRGRISLGWPDET